VSSKAPEKTPGSFKFNPQDRIMLCEIAMEIERSRGFVGKVAMNEALLMAVRFTWHNWVRDQGPIDEVALRQHLPGR
jgi:hypothetical protein